MLVTSKIIHTINISTSHILDMEALEFKGFGSKTLSLVQPHDGTSVSVHNFCLISLRRIMYQHSVAGGQPGACGPAYAESGEGSDQHSVAQHLFLFSIR